MKVLLTVTISFVMFWMITAQNITYIDLIQARFGEIPSNKIFEEIKFIPLETHTDALLDIRNTKYYLTDKYIIAVTAVRTVIITDSFAQIGGKRAYIFDRNRVIHSRSKFFWSGTQ